jgi:hypothetical protein
MSGLEVSTVILACVGVVMLCVWIISQRHDS